MAVQVWEQEVAALIPRQLGLKVYRSNEQAQEGRCIGIYAEPGVGKTTLASQMADCAFTSPMLYINVSGGAWVFSDRDDITVVDVHTWTDFTTLSMRLFGAKTMPFKGILIDHATELQALNALAVMGIIGSAGGIRGTGMPSQQQWGASTAQMLNAIRGYHELTRKFGVVVVIIAQQDARKDSVTNAVVKSGIGFTPSLAKTFPAIMDIVGHLTVQNDPPKYTRVLSFAKTAHSDAKFRRNKTEVANSIPLTIAYQDQPVFVDFLNTLIGGKVWPTKKYDALAAKAKVEYATVAATDGNEGGIVADRVAELQRESPINNDPDVGVNRDIANGGAP